MKVFRLHFRTRVPKKDEKGQGLVEYTLILAIIALGALATMTTLASTVNSSLSTIVSAISSAT
jgi:Flp pilus assembly pilin Flp